MAHDETDRIKTAYRQWLVRLLFAWPAKKVILAYIAFFLVFLILVLIGGSDLVERQADSFEEIVFVLAIGPAWLVFGAIIGSFLISEMQLAVFRSLTHPSEFGRAWVKEIEAARKNSFYQKWLGKL